MQRSRQCEYPPVKFAYFFKPGTVLLQRVNAFVRQERKSLPALMIFSAALAATAGLRVTIDASCDI
jgi:hypothetical protein